MIAKCLIGGDETPRAFSSTLRFQSSFLIGDGRIPKVGSMAAHAGVTLCVVCKGAVRTGGCPYNCTIVTR